MLKVENMDIRYGAIHALKNVSISVGESEIVTVVGSNGAGKSSLLRALAGTVKPSSGKISFRGEKINSFSAPFRVKSGLTLVPEGRQIFVSMSVEENLLLGAHSQTGPEVKSSIESIFDRFWWVFGAKLGGEIEPGSNKNRPKKASKNNEKKVRLERFRGGNNARAVDGGGQTPS